MSYSGAKFHVFNCPDADLALTVTDDECEPYIPRGAAALVSLGGVVFDGDVGVSLHAHKIIIRQYCEDWAGNAHLLTLNRRRRERDIVLPRDGRHAVCLLGRVLDLGVIALPSR